MNRIPQDNQGNDKDPSITVNKFFKKEATCPNCLAVLDGCADMGPQSRNQPRDGDISICGECGDPCEFREDGTLQKMSEEKLKDLMQDPDFKKISYMVKSIKQSTDASINRKYSEQLNQMLEAVRSWKSENINLSPMIQYNFTREVCVVACLDDAIKKKLVSVNEDATTMFKELGWLDERPDTPTVLMVRVVLEHAFEG